MHVLPDRMQNAIVSFKQLGDIVLLEPLSRLLARRGERKTRIFARKDFSPVIDLMPDACLETFSFFHHFDELWAAHPGSKSTRKSVLLRARRKHVLVPFDAYNRRIHGIVYDQVHDAPIADRYWARYYWDEAGGEADAFTPPALAPPSPDWKPEDIPDDYIVCHPTAAWEIKFWSPEKWAQLIDFLQEETSVPVCLTSGPAAIEMRHCAEIIRNCRRSPHSLCGMLTIEQHLWVIANARAVFAIDGSACHLADAFGLPALKLFGRTSPDEWTYPRPGARVITSGDGSFHDRPPASEIAATEVLDAAAALIENLHNDS